MVLRQRFLSGTIYEGRAGNQDSCAGAAAIQAVEQMMRAEDIGGKRRLGPLPRLADMGRSRTVVHHLRFEAGDGREDGVAIEQIDALTRDPRLVRHPPAGTVPPHQISVASGFAGEMIDHMAAGKTGRARDEDGARHQFPR